MPSDVLPMTRMHPRWREFADRLGGPEGCNFRYERPGDATSAVWNCRGGWDQGNAYGILCAMGFTHGEAIASLEGFATLGGHCDCEILFNVDAGGDDAQR